MKDIAAIAFLVTHHGSLSRAAYALGVSPGRLNLWRNRRIPPEQRAFIWSVINSLRPNDPLPVEWLDPPESRAAREGVRMPKIGKRLPRRRLRSEAAA